MRSASWFTVLIERRRVAAAGVLLAGAALLALGPLPAHAWREPQADLARPAQAKIARDLQDEVRSPRRAAERWSRDVGGRRQVQLVLIASSDDPELGALRAEVLRLGGSVHARHPLVRGLTVQLPADKVAELAARADVASLSPNRTVRRTASVLEAATGADAAAVRSYGGGRYSGYDGSGVGIAVLDSGVMKSHRSFQNAFGATRVVRNVNLRNANLADWLAGVDSAISPAPNSPLLAAYEQAIGADNTSTHDPYGHGTHVASVAAGRGFYQAPDSTGIAPGASVYDVRVLDVEGNGSLSDVLEGIQWVVFHAREHNIRVMNLSLAAASTESWLTDPLCIAVRRASAAGITVVVAAGNFGLASNGKEVFGAISAPGNEPSVITVGSANIKGTAGRGDDSVNLFSSRGPTRGGPLVNGVRRPDNLLKPDLVAPGNRIVGAAATRASPFNADWNRLALEHPVLAQVAGATQGYQKTLMSMSGTSIAAPAVAGAAALLLQANPGLTPPLVKAILQYTAEPMAGAHLLQQGAGLLNVEGALALARALRTDIAGAVAAGTLAPGASLLATGKGMPAPQSVLKGRAQNWSRVVFAGGNRLFSGTGLFTQYQPIWDPRLTWAGRTVRRTTPQYWSGFGIAPNTFVKSFAEAPAANQALLGASVVDAGSLLGASSQAGRTGLFMPNTTLSAWLASGSGVVLSNGVVLSEGVILSEGLVLSEGVVLSEGMVLSEGLILSEGFVLSEGVVVSETGGSSPAFDTRGALKGEP